MPAEQQQKNVGAKQEMKKERRRNITSKFEYGWRNGFMLLSYVYHPASHRNRYLYFAFCSYFPSNGDKRQSAI